MAIEDKSEAAFILEILADIERLDPVLSDDVEDDDFEETDQDGRTIYDEDNGTIDNVHCAYQECLDIIMARFKAIKDKDGNPYAGMTTEEIFEVLRNKRSES